jgi:quercetin dioxygenase-like cupin family protein
MAMAIRRYSFLSALAALTTVLTAGVLATPPSGQLSSATFARGMFADPVDIKFKIMVGNEDVIHVPDAHDTVVVSTMYSPGGNTGWHSHPGPTIVLVKTGALTLYSADDPMCSGRTYLAGQAFVDPGQGHVHIGVNHSSVNTELWAVFLDVPPGMSPRIDAPAPGNCLF